MSQEKRYFSQWNPLIAESFIKSWEGLRLKAYHCAANSLTIGYGHTKNVQPGQVITAQEAEQLLKNDLVEHAEAISRYVTCKLTEGQFIALMSLVFNLGVNAVKNSETLKLLNAGKIEEAKRGFLSFSKKKVRDRFGNIVLDKNGKPVLETVKGLLNRRQAEVKLM